jgi:glycosyltransferase involved in cell wall biosynthesis
MPGVSIVIPCYNPPAYLTEAIASARAQRDCPVEVVLVDDGTDSPEGRQVLENARGLADLYLEQPNRGLAAARNAGFEAARHEWIVPLDADDVLEPDYAAACGAAMAAHPNAAFAYTDYHVFGAENFVERTPDYNLYQLLDRNVLTYAALIRKRVWAETGGYDESMHPSGYEDWEFWLNLGVRGRFGQHVPRVLFGYRKHGPSLLDTARARHAELSAHIRAKHPELYEYEARARVKARWAPAVGIVANEGQIGRQSILDWQRIEADAVGPEYPALLMVAHAPTRAALAPAVSRLFSTLRPRVRKPHADSISAPGVARSGTGPARPSSSPETGGDPAATGSVVPIGFLERSGTGPERPSSSPETGDDPAATGSVVPIGFLESSRAASDSAELAALAVWGGHDAFEFADGSVALSRRGFEKNLTPRTQPPATAAAHVPPRLETIHRHLANAGLLSLDAWTRRPLRSAARLIPLRLKERVNRAAVRISGRRLFDLSFYLQFQPSAVESGAVVAAPLVYMPEARSSRRRIGLVTPHLGPGGAERVLLEIAGALNPGAYEIFLIATQSTGDSWRDQWRQRAEHVYDLRKLIHAEKIAAGLYSICVNWELDALVIQNSLSAYSVLPQIKQRLPRLRGIDLIHSADADWNLVEATRKVDAALDVRVAMSAAVQRELIARGTSESKIRLILNGVDLDRFNLNHFNMEPESGAPGAPHRILFAGRLEAVKRPWLLVEIALRLRRRRARDDFRFVVAGDGPEAAGLRRRVRSHKLEQSFEFLGHVADIMPELAACEVLVLPSKSEGIPLIVLEAFAASRPVVASAIGGIPEVVTAETGILVPQGAAEIEKFAAALDLLISDPGLRRTLGTNGRRMVELGFDQRRAAQQYRALFES